MIWNRPYRPDLNGIEFMWADIKKRYRQIVKYRRINGIDFDHMELVKHVCEATDNDFAKRSAANGEKAIREAKPVEPMWWEEKPVHDYIQHQNALNLYWEKM